MKRIVPIVLIFSAVACTSRSAPVANTTVTVPPAAGGSRSSPSGVAPAHTAAPGSTPRNASTAEQPTAASPSSSSRPAPAAAGPGGSTLTLTGAVAGTMTATKVSCGAGQERVTGTVGARGVTISYKPAEHQFVGIAFNPATARSAAYVGNGGARIDGTIVTFDAQLDGQTAQGTRSGEREHIKGSVTCTSSTAG